METLKTIPIEIHCETPGLWVIQICLFYVLFYSNTRGEGPKSTTVGGGKAYGVG